ncbi:MAG: VWA domain-containing protein [Chitinophagaceae bacterium]
MNFRFQYGSLSWLWLLPVIALALFTAHLIWKKRVVRRIGEESWVGLLTRNHSSSLFFLKFILLFFALAAGILSAMNPMVPGSDNKVQRKGIDIAIALDVSRSMLATDQAPNRLERAKQFVGKLMDELPDDRLALVLFAGKAYMQMPLTTDHGASRLFVSSAGPDAVPQQGTVLSEALEMSARVFNSAEKRFKTVILISDGEDHDADAVRTAGELAEQGVMIIAVGVGSPDGSVIRDPLTGTNKTDASGNTVISRLNEDILRSVAEKTNGIYLNLKGSDEAVSQVKKQLSQIEKKSFGDISLMNFRTFYMWLATLMLGLLIAEFFIPERRRLAA